MNDKEKRLLELCSFHGLCITNTFFESKHQHKVSWKHPRSHKWHQLDLVIARRSSLNNVLATRSYHCADCDTDHAMVCSKVRLSPRKLHRSKPTYRTRIDVARTADPQRREQFVASSCIRWFDIGALPCLQRCQTRLCPCSNIVWDLLLPPSVIWHLLAHHLMGSCSTWHVCVPKQR